MSLYKDWDKLLNGQTKETIDEFGRSIQRQKQEYMLISFQTIMSILRARFQILQRSSNVIRLSSLAFLMELQLA